VLYDLAGYANREALWWELLPSSGFSAGQLGGCLPAEHKEWLRRRLGGERTCPTDRSAKLSVLPHLRGLRDPGARGLCPAV